MIVAAHQPQYLPYLGYFYKMSLVDTFVILDHVQYARNKVQNRNEIRGPAGRLALSVPVRASREDAIASVRIDNTQHWATKHWRSIHLAYRGYPHFDRYALELEAVYHQPWEFLVDLNLRLTRLCMGWLGLATVLRRSSDLGVTTKGSAMIRDVCRAVGGSSYVTGAGSRDYIEPEQFREAGVRLLWSAFQHPDYAQRDQPYLPELSLIDVLMNLGPDARELLEKARNISVLRDDAASHRLEV